MNLQNIRLEFLPPNTTSILQPMDQGVIKCFKGHFRMALVLKMIENSERGLPMNVNVLDAVLLMTAAWEKVTAATISNCFTHAGFRDTLLKPNDPFVEIRSHVDQLGVSLPIPFDEFVNLDNAVHTAEVLSEEAILQSVLGEGEDDDDDDDNNEDESLPGAMDVPSTAEARKAVGTLQAFLLTNCDMSPSEREALRVLSETVEKKFYDDVVKNCKQLKITEFMPATQQ